MSRTWSCAGAPCSTAGAVGRRPSACARLARRRPPAHRRRCAAGPAPSRVPRGAGARAEQGFQFLARTSAVPKLHGELARCPGTAAAAGPRAGAGAATRTGIAPAPAPARGLRCRPAAAPRPSAGRPRSARAWRRESRRIPGTRWWTPRPWRWRPTTACAARSAISTGRSSTRSNVRRGAGPGGAGARRRPCAARLVSGAGAQPRPDWLPKCSHIGLVHRAARPWRGRTGPRRAGRHSWRPGAVCGSSEPRRPEGGEARRADLPGVRASRLAELLGFLQSAAPRCGRPRSSGSGTERTVTNADTTHSGRGAQEGGPPFCCVVSRVLRDLQSLRTTVVRAPPRLRQKLSPLGEGWREPVSS